MKKKIVLIAIYVLTLALLVASGSTIAWLIAESGTVTNTFTPSNINITLSETTPDTLKMIPGTTIEKNPQVTVAANSEACWLFVKIEETDNFDTYMQYLIDTGWKFYSSGVDGVNIDTVANDKYIIYREVPSSSSIQEFYILKDNDVLVPGTVTKEDMNLLYNSDGTFKTEVLPKLKFTAAAIQKENIADVTTAFGSLPSVFTTIS
ncbi:MAG: hypothetical protein J6S71_10120 [Clostridia bacterium]|nr:hypothetical protein [Clostridia bacterium]